MIEDVLSRIAKALEGIEARLADKSFEANALPVVETQYLAKLPKVKKPSPKETAAEDAPKEPATRQQAADALVNYVKGHDRQAGLKLLQSIKKDAKKLDDLSDVEWCWTKVVEACNA